MSTAPTGETREMRVGIPQAPSPRPTLMDRTEATVMGGEGRESGRVAPWRREWRKEGGESRRELPRAAPVKHAPWEPYLPVYFWLGGIAAGGWLAVTSEDWLGERDASVIRIGRYLAAGSTIAGTGILIADLGRSDRFLNMLRLVQPRSAMSLGSWGLAAFGTVSGAAATLQVAEDLIGSDSTLGKLSKSSVGRTLHLGALPLALFLGSYTGILLASTSTPAWARQRLTLPPLFLASGVATGMSTTGAIASLNGRGDTRRRRDRKGRVQRRLARATAVALTVDLIAKSIAAMQRAELPSGRGEKTEDAGAGRSGTREITTLLLGTVAPLALSLARGTRRKKKTETFGALATAALTLAGSLATRFAITQDGYQSAKYAPDTWAMTALDGAERR